MKTLANIVTLLVVLGVCLPSSAEILVYKTTRKVSLFQLETGPWVQEKRVSKSYLVLDLNYDDYTITQAVYMECHEGSGGKWFDRDTGHSLELVRVVSGAKAQWLIMDKKIVPEGQEVPRASLRTAVGQAHKRKIGAPESREVANALSGYTVSDNTDEEGRDINVGTCSLTLYPAWTSWANGDQGNQSFEATLQMIENYLIAKGYANGTEW